MADSKVFGRSATEAKELVLSTLRTIESILGCTRHFLATGEGANGVNEALDYRVNEALDLIVLTADRAKYYTQVGPTVETLEAARKDRAVQRLIKKASRKTPI